MFHVHVRLPPTLLPGLVRSYQERKADPQLLLRLSLLVGDGDLILSKIVN